MQDRQDILDITRIQYKSFMDALDPMSPYIQLENQLAKNMLQIGMSLTSLVDCFKEVSVTGQVSDYTEDSYQKAVESLVKTLCNVEKIVQVLPQNEIDSLNHKVNAPLVESYYTNEGYIEVKVMGVLPHLRSSDSFKSAYNRLLQRQFDKLSMENKLVKVEKVYMVFRHFYKDSTADVFVRDVDNNDEKYLSDLVAREYILGSDGPKNVRRMSISSPAVEDFTTVTLVPFDKITSYIANYLDE